LKAKEKLDPTFTWTQSLRLAKPFGLSANHIFENKQL
jgi:hypothetical protein